MASCSPQSSDGPSFTGVYADEFQRAYNSTDIQFVKDILADSTITDAEFEEFKQQYASCMDDHGITWTYGLDGVGEQMTGNAGNPNPDDSQIKTATQACSATTGYDQIVPLYAAKHGIMHNVMRWTFSKHSG